MKDKLIHEKKSDFLNLQGCYGQMYILIRRTGDVRQTKHRYNYFSAETIQELVTHREGVSSLYS